MKPNKIAQSRWRQPPKPQNVGANPSLPKRNAALDTLRGVAILLMVIDHVAFFFFDQPIGLDTIRLPTRLSFGLFTILMGYFLPPLLDRPFNPRRLAEISLAALLLNAWYYDRYQRIEILGSLVVCYAIFLLLRGHFVWMWGAFFACMAAEYLGYSKTIFDFPLTVVLTFVSQGIIVRRLGWQWGVLASCCLLVGSFTISPPTAYVFLFAPIATALVCAGIKFPNWRIPGLDLVGKYPLLFYCAQYLVFAICTS